MRVIMGRDAFFIRLMMKDKRRIFMIVAAVAFMALLSVAFFYPDDIDGRTLSQHDMQQGIANGHEGQEYKERTGEATRWTNSLYGGMPTFQISPSYEANSLMDWMTKAYGLWLPAPANLLFAMMIGFFIMGLCMEMRWYVALFGAVAWAFSTYFIIIIGAGHIWKFVTLSYIPPTIGGIWLCYRGKYLWGASLAALFGSLQLMANHPQMSYYFGFVIVALMGAMFMNLRKEGKTRRWLVATGCVLGAGVLALAANCASLYNTAQYAKETIRGRATYLSSDDGEKPKGGGADFDYITQWSYGGDETLTLLVPNAKGGATIKPVAGENTPMSVVEVDGADGIALDAETGEYQWVSQFNQYFGNQPMTNGPVYVGAFVLALAILALCICRGPLRWWLLGVTVLGILLAWGHNFEWFSRLFVDYFPGYSKFRTVSSILVIVEFTIPLLAMMGVARIIEICREPDGGEARIGREKLARRLLTVCGALGLVCLLLWMFPSLMGSGLSQQETDALREADLFRNPDFAPMIQAVKELRLSLVRADAMRSLLFLALGTAVVWAYVKGWYRQAWVMVAGVLVFSLIDLYSVDKRYVDHENFTQQTTITFEENDADRQILQDPDPHYRVMDMNGMGGARSSYFHKTIGGYHAAKLTRYNDLLERQVYANNIGVINMLNTKYFMGQVPDEQGNQVWVAEQNPDALGNAWWVSRIDYVEDDDAEMAALDSLDTRVAAVANKEFAKTLGQASAPAGDDRISLTSYEPNELKYKADSRQGGVAVFSEIYFPWGWKATIDGKEAEIARVNYVLRALKVPAGKHEIVFTFDPESLHVTNGIAVGAVAVIYLLLAVAAGLWVAGLVKRRKS